MYEPYFAIRPHIAFIRYPKQDTPYTRAQWLHVKKIYIYGLQRPYANTQRVYSAIRVLPMSATYFLADDVSLVSCTEIIIDIQTSTHYRWGGRENVHNTLSRFDDKATKKDWRLSRGFVLSNHPDEMSMFNGMHLPHVWFCPKKRQAVHREHQYICLLYTSPSPRD